MLIQQSPPRDVVVRFARTELFQNTVLGARAETVLDEGERAILDRLHSGAARRDYLAAHALARKVIAEIAQVNPAELRVRVSEGRRPEFVLPPNTRNFRYSISHAGGIALCAVAEQRSVGADVECIGNIGHDPLSVARVICSAREMKALCALPLAARGDRLLAIWTSKEAVAKAMGLGFTVEMDRITILFRDDGAPTVRLEAGAPGAAQSWRLASWRVAPDSMAAVAVSAAPDDEIKFKIDEERDLLAAKRHGPSRSESRPPFGRPRNYPGMRRPVQWWASWYRNRPT
jgi:4'-phosphopantetheinyl transferase